MGFGLLIGLRIGLTFGYVGLGAVIGFFGGGAVGVCIEVVRNRKRTNDNAG